VSQFPILSGVLPMLITPFDQEGRPDERSLIRLIDHVLASEADGVAVLGLASEAHALSDGERRRLTELILAHIAGRLPVLVAATAESTALALGLARHAEQHGAAAVMLAPPYTTRAGPAALALHYGAVAGGVSLPIMIQDAPGYIGTGLGPSLIAQLVRQHPNIRYVKTEELPAGVSVANLRDQLDEDVAIFSGAGGLYLLDTLDAGAAGTIPGCDVPELLVAVVRAYRLGHIPDARALFRNVLPLLVYQLQSLDLCVACTKAVLVHRGIITHGDLRPPGLILDRWARAQLLDRYHEVSLSL
jgi:2-keto-3-deoxy-L-arabinonate dehydratase